MAARLMLSGVGKSGSPAPKSTTSSPWRRRRSASADTFMVDETVMVDIRSVSPCSVCIILSSPFKSALETRLHRGRHQARNTSAQRNHFLHQVRADEGVRFAGHQKRRLDLW